MRVLQPGCVQRSECAPVGFARLKGGVLGGKKQTGVSWRASEGEGGHGEDKEMWVHRRRRRRRRRPQRKHTNKFAKKILIAVCF